MRVANPEALATEAVLRVRLRQLRAAELSKDAGARERARSTLNGFCHWTYPGYLDAPHLTLIDQALEDVERGECDRLLVEMPPRHGKTEKISIRFPAFYLLRNPTKKIISESYDDDLATENGRQVRNIVATQSLFDGVRLAPDSKAKALWHTSAGGQYFAGSVGSSSVGWGANLIIIDDPHGKANIVTSQVQREHAWQWYTTELYNRREPGAAIILVMHRWHEDDLAGRVLASEPERWRVIRLPALAEGGDPVGRDLGEALWPERYDRIELESTRRVVGEREWNAKYQQRPAPAEGAIFKWFPRYTELGAVREIDIPYDTAYGTEKQSDYTAWAGWSWDGSCTRLIEAGRYRGETPEAERHMAMFEMKMRSLYPHARIKWLHRSSVAIDKVEAQHMRAGIATIGMDGKLSRRGFDVTEVKIPSGFGGRGRSELGSIVSVHFEGGRALVPELTTENREWLEPWLEEHKGFDTFPHDDWVEGTILVLWHRFRSVPFQRPAPRPLWAEGV